MKNFNSKTSWQPVHRWYQENVGEEGHYYHRQVILPKLLAQIKEGPIVDLACGQGILGRKLGPHISYTGYDIAPALIKLAKSQDTAATHHYVMQDVTTPIKSDQKYREAVCLLAAQNIENLPALFSNAAHLLEPHGRFHLVLNHPCFRIPRQSSWGEEVEKKLQYRRLDRYLTPLSIPIQANPGKGDKSAATLSFHYPLQAFIKAAKAAGFCLADLEEWISDKVSTGAKAKMENRAREEFPLFLYLNFVKLY